MICVKNGRFLECITFPRGDVVKAHADDVAWGLEDPGGELFEYPDNGVGNAFAAAQIARLLEMIDVDMRAHELSRQRIITSGTGGGEALQSVRERVRVEDMVYYFGIAERQLRYARDHGLRIVSMILSAEGDGMRSIGRSIGRMYGARYNDDKNLIDIGQAVL